VAKTTVQTDWTGKPIMVNFIRPGGKAMKLRVATCNDCGEDVAWAPTTTRTVKGQPAKVGQWYLVSVHWPSSNPVARANDRHDCDGEARRTHLPWGPQDGESQADYNRRMLIEFIDEGYGPGKPTPEQHAQSVATVDKWFPLDGDK
jgi:hypothetical protein